MQQRDEMRRDYAESSDYAETIEYSNLGNVSLYLHHAGQV